VVHCLWNNTSDLLSELVRVDLRSCRSRQDRLLPLLNRRVNVMPVRETLSIRHAYAPNLLFGHWCVYLREPHSRQS